MIEVQGARKGGANNTTWKRYYQTVGAVVPVFDAEPAAGVAAILLFGPTDVAGAAPGAIAPFS